MHQYRIKHIFFFFFKTYLSDIVIIIKYCCGLYFTIDNIQDLVSLSTALWEITFYGKTWKTLQMCSLWMIFLLVREKSQMFFYFGMLEQVLALRDGKSSDLNLYTLNNDNKREIWCSFILEWFRKFRPLEKENPLLFLSHFQTSDVLDSPCILIGKCNILSQ